MKRATVTKGSGNIFRDLGFSEERSAELILKSSLLQALQETIRERGWKQAEAADSPRNRPGQGVQALSRTDGRIFCRTFDSLSFCTGPRCGSDSAACSTWTAIRYGPYKGIETIEYVIGISIGEGVMIKNGMRPVHPGEILFEEFMKPAEPPINANMLAKALEVPANRITAIIKGQRGITGDTAVRLATLFDTTAEFWMNLQKTYELRLAEQALPGKVRKHIEQHRGALIPA